MSSRCGRKDTTAMKILVRLYFYRLVLSPAYLQKAFTFMRVVLAALERATARRRHPKPYHRAIF